jgi:hypothetical protein
MEDVREFDALWDKIVRIIEKTPPHVYMTVLATIFIKTAMKDRDKVGLSVCKSRFIKTISDHWDAIVVEEGLCPKLNKDVVILDE